MGKNASTEKIIMIVQDMQRMLEITSLHFPCSMAHSTRLSEICHANASP
jgi:hypothetical protein